MIRPVTARKTTLHLLMNFYKKRSGDMGLGEKGKKQVRNGATSGLFAKTEPINTKIQDYENIGIEKYKY